jgi:hypothetical protein
MRRASPKRVAASAFFPWFSRAAPHATWIIVLDGSMALACRNSADASSYCRRDASAIPRLKCVIGWSGWIRRAWR